MNRRYSLRGRALFARLYREGKRCQFGDVLLRYLPDASGLPVFAFSASRSVGNSVTRNRVRRVYKEAVRGDLSAWPPGLYHLRFRAKADRVSLRSAVDVLRSMRSMIHG